MVSDYFPSKDLLVLILHERSWSRWVASVERQIAELPADAGVGGWPP